MSEQYQPLPPHVDLPALERDVIARWRASRVFERSLEQTAEGPTWIFYEGPPTANGMPGTHHVEARVFKDIFPRYKTMRGYSVPRRAGWDCHGLPVELAVEKELGFSGKPDIEAYGIAEFNARCRENVQRHVDAFESMSERMGYWADYEHAYWTMTPDFVESVWWALKQIFDKGLLVEDFRVAPYCTRCGTGLSDHELAQGYQEDTDPSVYVRLPLTSGPLAGRASMLVWTTTTWTLPTNALVAVRPDVEYVAATRSGRELPSVTDGTETVVVARALMAKVLGDGWEVVESFRGEDMLGWTYQRPFEIIPWQGPGHFVVAEDYVTTDDGTGLVHEATVYGEVDFESVRRNGVELINRIDRRGHFDADLPLIGGMFFKDADAVLIADMAERGVLFRRTEHTHSYPHCWRCETPLMYYALPAWYIRTTAMKEQLLAENEATAWYPATIKHGRYGDWLDNNIDWALSRDRYWGTPLPVWRNDADPTRLVCVGSLAELGELAGRDLSALDPHRPYVDDVTFTRPGEEGTYRRVPQVIDAWFDSGSMPFGQFGAPWRNNDAFTEAYPADFICEAIDQTRGWFYWLMAVGTLVFGRSSYRTVLCLGHILADDGRKMSKHLGNILEPISLMDRHGADALRWFMLCSGSPWSARRVGHKVLDEVASKVIRTYWSIASFQSLYARANNWTPPPWPLGGESAGGPPGNAADSALDMWARAEVSRTVAEVSAALDDFDTQRAGRALATLIDDLSNWYVRRSRRRFWDGDPAALATLHECLHVLTRLLAPFVPFVTDEVWRALFGSAGEAPDSVHLAPWPQPEPAAIDTALSARMTQIRRLVELGRAARAESGVKTRQPLARALVSAPGWSEMPDELRDELADELNVVSLAALGESADLVDVVVKPNFRALGRRFGGRTQAVARAIVAADQRAFAQALADGSASVTVDGTNLAVSADEVIVTETPRSGWAVASAAAETVALDLELTDELRRDGMARESVRLVQETRKAAGLQVSDRIELCWQVVPAQSAQSAQSAQAAQSAQSAQSEPARALRERGEHIAAEVLAVSIEEAAPPEPTDAAGWHGASDDGLGLRIWLRRVP